MNHIVSKSIYFINACTQSEDLKYLELLSAQEKEDAKLSITRRKAAQADVNWMKTVVAEQLDIEKERQIELESLYQLVVSS